jgi:hypothetical protein
MLGRICGVKHVGVAIHVGARWVSEELFRPGVAAIDGIMGSSAVGAGEFGREDSRS